jgi:Rrf2 family protein
MLLSRASQYAISGVLRLAALPPSGFCRVEDLVRGTSAPRHAVAKVFQAMAKRNILDSVRGAGGGFRLGSRTLEMSLLELIEAVEGPFESSAAMERGLCAADEVCPMHRLLQPLTDELKRVLRSTRVRDLVPGPASAAWPCCGGAACADSSESTSSKTTSSRGATHEHEST